MGFNSERGRREEVWREERKKGEMRGRPRGKERRGGEGATGGGVGRVK